MDTITSRPEGWRFLPLVLPMLLPLCDPPAAAQARVTDPAEIDRAVAAFTGAATGTPGGARVPADPRLRLAACGGALAVSWHTPAKTAVQVECPGPSNWRIFVAVAPAQGGPAAAGRAAPAVKRGDALTIMVRGRGFSVQQSGEAMEAGGVGDWIFVRTGRKAEGLRARIERPGLAVIPAG
ncbi:flagella basal body P-ring formation protein FlgA [Porphyrobacter sp. CACIAM 03H1]|jgi:flagella basal body P-ring formation protein FlgA|uniref:flagella basal body P-ring formation protein FlgA n=1 Tax=Porphyrobacter sp. CACIAM 03H1 TaxID=2003315 RepID=UPI001F46C912|nr:flagella basal body P-ring formation protein FlgA [Porphyrobacter sp. CACIAM 03H1]